MVIFRVRGEHNFNNTNTSVSQPKDNGLYFRCTKVAYHFFIWFYTLTFTPQGKQNFSPLYRCNISNHYTLQPPPVSQQTPKRRWPTPFHKTLLTVTIQEMPPQLFATRCHSTLHQETLLHNKIIVAMISI